MNVVSESDPSHPTPPGGASAVDTVTKLTTCPFEVWLMAILISLSCSFVVTKRHAWKVQTVISRSPLRNLAQGFVKIKFKKVIKLTLSLQLKNFTHKLPQIATPITKEMEGGDLGNNICIYLPNLYSHSKINRFQLQQWAYRETVCKQMKSVFCVHQSFSFLVRK